MSNNKLKMIAEIFVVTFIATTGIYGSVLLSLALENEEIKVAVICVGVVVSLFAGGAFLFLEHYHEGRHIENEFQIDLLNNKIDALTNKVHRLERHNRRTNCITAPN